MNVRSVNRASGKRPPPVAVHGKHARGRGRAFSDPAKATRDVAGPLIDQAKQTRGRGRALIELAEGTRTSGRALSDQAKQTRGRGRALIELAEGTRTRGRALSDQAKQARGRGRALIELAEGTRTSGRALSDQAKQTRGIGRALIDQAKQTRGRGRPLVDDKRRRILDAALVLFAKRGYHGTAVPDVADATGVGTGTLYRYFEDKQHLVNEVYRDAKQRLKAALLDGLSAPSSTDDAERWFHELWDRLASFARAEPHAFRFLEMQDHVEYLDAKSRALELTVLAPLWLTGKRLFAGGPPVDVAIALLWGAFVGVVKAQRLGYLALDDKKLRQAGAAAWRLIAPQRSTTQKGH